MRRVTLFTAILLVGLAMLLGLSSRQASAEEAGVAFTITPPIFELRANAGDRLDEVISIFNNGSEDLQIAATVENLKPQGEAGQVQVISDSAEALPSLKDWIKLGPVNSFSLKKGETKNVNIAIDIPGNAEPGGHFATVLFGNVNSQIRPGTSAVSQKIGSLVLLTVAGQAREDARVLTFSPQKKTYWQNQKIGFNLRIKNSGNVYVRPRGFLVITNIFGQKISTVEIEGKNILPGATRQIPLDFSHKRLFGLYAATLTLVYGNTNQNLNSSVGFTIIPWKETAVALAVIIVLFLLRRRLVKAVLILVRGDKSVKQSHRK